MSGRAKAKPKPAPASRASQASGGGGTNSARRSVSTPGGGGAGGGAYSTSVAASPAVGLSLVTRKAGASAIASNRAAAPLPPPPPQPAAALNQFDALTRHHSEQQKLLVSLSTAARTAASLSPAALRTIAIPNSAAGAGAASTATSQSQPAATGSLASRASVRFAPDAIAIPVGSTATAVRSPTNRSALATSTSNTAAPLALPPAARLSEVKRSDMSSTLASFATAPAPAPAPAAPTPVSVPAAVASIPVVNSTLALASSPLRQAVVLPVPAARVQRTSPAASATRASRLRDQKINPVKAAKTNLKPHSAAVLSAALQQQFLSDLSTNLVPHTVSRGGAAGSSGPVPTANRQNAAQQLTLAQQIGIIAKPAPRLNAEEWAKVRDLALTRQYNELPCPICQDSFRSGAGADHQVLLSCTHTFHRICLRSFEKFSGQKQCPICRRKEYETITTTDGATAYRTAAATKIQARYRAWSTRRRYLAMLAAIPPKDGAKRREWFLARWQKASNQLSQIADAKESAIDALFAELDSNVQQSRAAMAEIDMYTKTVSLEEWQAIEKRARERAVTDCPICMTAFVPSKPTVLTTCSHCFHANCLSNFERFTVAGANATALNNSLTAAGRPQSPNRHAGGGGSGGGSPSRKQNGGCPICRQSYQKMVWVF